MAPILNVVLSLLLPVSSAASALVKPSTLLSSRSTDGTEIVGGTTASLAEFPYIVSLTKNHTLWCGGMLLNPYTVLTAAHCSESPASPSLVTVRAGSAEWASGGIQVNVSEFVVHPSYNGTAIDNDIALWHLSTPIVADSTIGYATLPAQDSDAIADTIVTTAGWGTTKFRGEISSVLRKVSIPIVGRALCKSEYADFRVHVTDNMICAGLLEGGKDSCQGDSGGPIIDTTTNVTLGIVSWGNGCANASWPGVYTRLGNYVTWVNSMKWTS